MNKYEITDQEVVFDCGCSFRRNNKEIIFNADLHNPNHTIDFECPETYRILSEGITEGVFQLGSPLGRTWCMKLQPTEMEHISALGALLRPGCLQCISGDTDIAIRMYVADKNGNRKFKKIKIRDLYTKFKKDHFLYEKHIVSCDEKTLQPFNNKILDVFYNGKQEVYELDIRIRKRNIQKYKFHKLKSTLNHRYLVRNKGWKKLIELEQGDKILVVNSRKEYLSRNTKNFDKEKSFRDVCYAHYDYQCIFCDWKEGSLDVNHVDGNRKSNNHPDNLSFLCPNHHRMYTEGNIDKNILIKEREQHKLEYNKYFMWATYEGKTLVGLEDVYDISVEGPNNNYLAGHVVVHNSRDADNNTITVRYERKKNIKMPLTSYHPIVDKILEKTYGENIYQETSLELAKQCAGFSLVDADLLRKGIGKKIPEIIAQCKKDFLSKGKELGIFTDEQLEEIFGWIEASQRYSFNHSLTENTTVSCQDGKRRSIVDLIVGDYILAPSKDFKTDQWVKITKIYNHGIQPVFKAETSAGHCIECTTEHKFLCSDNRIRRLKDIIGEHAIRLRNNQFDAFSKITFIGYAHTYDISVKNSHHLFYANDNIITSNSHAWSYGLNGYITAYLKAHFPRQFYKSWLANEDKRENYFNLINEAKLFNIEVYPPDLRHFKPQFYIHAKHIYFGLENIKGLVKKDLAELSLTFAEKEWSFEDLNKKITWLDFMSVALESVSSKTAEALIHSGAIDCFGVDRAVMSYEYDRWNELSNGEKKQFSTWKGDNLIDYVKYLINEAEIWYQEKLKLYNEKIIKRQTSTRKKKKEPKPLEEPKEDRRLPKLRQILQELTSPIYNILDTVDSIIFAEENLLGVALSKHKTDEIPLASETANCLEIANGRKGRCMLKVKIEQARTSICKTGDSMCFMEVSDKTSKISAIAFTKAYAEFQPLLTRGSIVYMAGELGDRGSFLINKVHPT